MSIQIPVQASQPTCQIEVFLTQTEPMLGGALHGAELFQ